MTDQTLAFWPAAGTTANIAAAADVAETDLNSEFQLAFVLAEAAVHRGSSYEWTPLPSMHA